MMERTGDTVTLTRKEYAALRKQARAAEEAKALCSSKKIWRVSFAVTILLTTVTVCAFCMGLEISSLVTLCALAWTELGAATGFYYWKARSENKIKLTLGLVDELAEKYGIDAVVQLAGVAFNN